MDMQDQLADLRDIHLPPDVGWWPPAPGWWVLALLLAALLALLALWLRKRKKRRAPYVEALRLLAVIEDEYLHDPDNQKLAQSLSILIRRVMLVLQPRQQVASLSGDDWLQRVDDLAGEPLFQSPIGRSFVQAIYRPQTQLDANELIGLTRRWLRRAGRV